MESFERLIERGEGGSWSPFKKTNGGENSVRPVGEVRIKKIRGNA